MTVETSAPGKAVLCGEYAVLDGAPAIAMAIGRRATVRIAKSGEASHRVTAPGLYDTAARFHAGVDGSIEWLDDAGDARRFALLEAVWRAVAPAGPECFALVLDTRAFFREPGSRKLGFGSSAALAVALSAALMPQEALAGALYQAAASAHRAFQGGKGSGVDVAAAVHGGVIGYRMDPPQVDELEWPAGLHFELLWSGKPASTAGKLARLAGAPRRASAAVLGERAAGVLAAWRGGSSRAVLDSLRAYTDSLQRFSDEHDLGVFGGGHRELVAVAHDRGLVYKPCGAGGGDIGIAFGEDRTALADFAGNMRARGFEPLAIARDPHGVRRAGMLAQ